MVESVVVEKDSPKEVEKNAALEPLATARWLEGNSWVLDVNGVNILLDPLFSTLDFGMPALISADKVVLKDYEALAKETAAQADYVLITQGLADHCCPKTLEMLAKLLPERVRIVAPPSAKPVLSKFFPRERITYLMPGEKSVLRTETSSVSITTFKGALVGPPTQDNENAYLLDTGKGKSLFYEPHCMFDPGELMRFENPHADVVFCPAEAIKVLGVYQLLNSGEKAVELANILGAKKIVSFDNNALDSEGVLNYIARTDTTVEELDAAAKKAGIEHVTSKPGVTFPVL
jgi:L-ascorbate metabolism protein UlaG (beta-lactamase superfamily)